MNKSAASCAVASSPEASFLAALSRKDSICGFMVALLNLLNVCVAFSVGVLGIGGTPFISAIWSSSGRVARKRMNSMAYSISSASLLTENPYHGFAVFVCAFFAGGREDESVLKRRRGVGFGLGFALLHAAELFSVVYPERDLSLEETQDSLVVVVGGVDQPYPFVFEQLLPEGQTDPPPGLVYLMEFVRILMIT